MQIIDINQIGCEAVYIDQAAYSKGLEYYDKNEIGGGFKDFVILFINAYLKKGSFFFGKTLQLNLLVSYQRLPTIHSKIFF